MKKFLYRSLKVFLLFVGFHIILMLIVEISSVREYVYERKYPVPECFEPSDYVFLGSSSFKYQVIPSQLEDSLKGQTAINLGRDARTPVQMYYTYQSDPDFFQHAKIVFVSLDPWVFSRLYFRNDIFLISHWGVSERIHFSLFESGTERIKALIGHKTSIYIQNYYKILTNRFQNCPPNDGFVPIKIDKNINMRADARKYYRLDEFRFSTYQFRMLKQLIQSLSTDTKAKVCFIITPKHSLRRESVQEYCSEDIQEFVDRFNSEIGDVFLLNYNTLIPEDIEDDVFRDAIHLDESGAEILTDTIARDIDSGDIQYRALRAADFF